MTEISDNPYRQSDFLKENPPLKHEVESAIGDGRSLSQAYYEETPENLLQEQADAALLAEMVRSLQSTGGRVHASDQLTESRGTRANNKPQKQRRQFR